MHFSTVTSISVVLAGFLLVAATPVTTDLVVARTPTRSIVSTTRHIYDRNGTKIATIKDGVVSGNVDVATLEPLLDPQIVTEAFKSVVAITQAVCNTSGPIFCGVLGTVTVNGVFHDLHYQRNGSFSGLRSIQHGPVDQMDKREDFYNAEDNNDGGMVVDYYYIDENETACDSFDSTSTLVQDFANDAIADMESSETIIECAEFDDSNGLLNGGLLTVGWNGQAYQFDEPNESYAVTAQCYGYGSE
ncbi:hypothetical protein B0H21DRAFT_708772 [Amylocystis lapponica]|nr:hypothetical protein B0H21DRAFT_708772 [Amylocystis lapponica]